MEMLSLGKPNDPGRFGGDNHLTLEAVLWIARKGSPWNTVLSAVAVGLWPPCRIVAREFPTR